MTIIERLESKLVHAEKYHADGLSVDTADLAAVLECLKAQFEYIHCLGSSGDVNFDIVVGAEKKVGLK